MVLVRSVRAPFVLGGRTRLVQLSRSPASRCGGSAHPLLFVGCVVMASGNTPCQGTKKPRPCEPRFFQEVNALTGCAESGIGESTSASVDFSLFVEFSLAFVGNMSIAPTCQPGLPPQPPDDTLPMNAKYLSLIVAMTSVASAQPLTFDFTGDPVGALLKASQIARACPWEGAMVHTVPATHSMQPTLDSGCYVVVARKPWDNVQVGDVALFDRKAMGFVSAVSVMHRAVARFDGRNGKVFLLQGDNNARPDSGTFGEADYLSTVYAVVRFERVPAHRSISTRAIR